MNFVVRTGPCGIDAAADSSSIELPGRGKNESRDGRIGEGGARTLAEGVKGDKGHRRQKKGEDRGIWRGSYVSGCRGLYSVS